MNVWKIFQIWILDWMKNNCKNFDERKIVKISMNEIFLKFQWMKNCKNLNEWKITKILMKEK